MSMLPILNSTIIMLAILSIINSNMTVFASESNSNVPIASDFTKDLKFKISSMISNALNDTDNILNSSMLHNQSNLTSSNLIISNNRVMSTVNNNGTDSSSSSIIKDRVKTINGVCTSTKVGGNGNDTLASSGNCNDEMTGGPGADKFMCGEGNDIVRDYNPEEGDIILDKQNCEKIQ